MKKAQEGSKLGNFEPAPVQAAAAAAYQVKPENWFEGERNSFLAEKIFKKMFQGRLDRQQNKFIFSRPSIF